MPRVMAIDFGLKRTGLAVSDPLKIIATGLTTVPTIELIPFLKKYFVQEPVELIVIGLPRNLDNTDTDATALVEKCIVELNKHFPSIPVRRVDERLTSKMAKDAMLDMGLKKMKRREKGIVDEIAATIILKEYLQQV